jgi:cytochrome P450
VCATRIHAVRLVLICGVQTTSAIQAVIMAFALHPEVVRRAQEEIDAVVGRDRLPEHSDRASLPYISAICKEILRWHTIAPLGSIRASIRDDIYEGLLIPAG